ncbi:MAG: antibiotic biosynthesis monooxygenase, partial [Pseudomonadota bacterium]
MVYKRRRGFLHKPVLPERKVFFTGLRSGQCAKTHSDNRSIRKLGLKFMFVITAEFRLKPDMLDAFMPLMLIQSEKSLSGEPGCLVFDVCLEH